MATTITITGYPLPSPVTFRKVHRDLFLDNDAWLLTRAQAFTLLDAWADAPTDGTDTIREWAHFEIGLIVTSLTLEGTTGMSGWESADGSDGSDIYSTANMPFDFAITPTQVD